MPAKNVEQLRQKAAALKKKLAEKGESLSGAAARARAKKIRRLQRRRRVMEADAKRKAGGAKKAE